MNLEEYAESIAWELAYWMGGMEDPDYPVDQLGDLSLELSSNFRALAITALLVKGDNDLFCHHLIRSGLARKTYLQRLRTKGVKKDHHLCSGRYEPLLDSLAAGDYTLAKRIADLSPKEFKKNQEYKDDYCYAQILHRFVLKDVPIKEFKPLIEQFEGYLEGDSSVRINLCKALLNKDQEAFEETFDEFINERETKIAKDIERGQSEEPQVVAERHVFIEGLAVLRLAERQGIETQREYRYCPSLARIPMSTPFPGD
jgi:hypothetical protein